MSGAPPVGDPSTPVPQRLVLVLPSTGEYDSRTYRIASAAAARGHEVTVVARWRPGIPLEEAHPAGYRIRRVPVAAIDGLPFPWFVRTGRVALRRLYALRTRTAYRPPVDPYDAAVAAARKGETSGSTVHASASAPGLDGVEASAPASAGSLAARQASLPRRLASGLIRRSSIFLTIRSQVRRTREVAPAADLYHGMAYMGIPVALDLARRHRAATVYDARDIYVDAANLAKLPSSIRRLVGRLERGWARKASRVVTVNLPYAEVMARRWAVELPLIVLNCSYRFTPPEPRERRFHQALGLAPETRVVLYQGGFSAERGIEELIEAIPSIPGAVLVLMGYGNLRERLDAIAAAPATGGRVRVLGAVPPNELLSWVASADVVAMPIQPSTLNHRLTTPNKLFEAMAVGVPVVASDMPGMAPIVRETGCGLVCDPTDPVAIAAAIRELLGESAEASAERRRRTLAAAHETYNWERQAELLLGEYGRLTGKPW